MSPVVASTVHDEKRCSKRRKSRSNINNRCSDIAFDLPKWRSRNNVYLILVGCHFLWWNRLGYLALYVPKERPDIAKQSKN